MRIEFDTDPPSVRLSVAELEPGSREGKASGSFHLATVEGRLTDESRGMFGAAQLNAMKPSARLINVARGAVLDESALIAALQTKQIAGAALDVTTIEPLPGDSPLWSMPEVIISPHMSGDYIGYPKVVASAFIKNFQRYRAGQSLLNVVDKLSGFVLSGDNQEPPPG